MSKKHQIGYSLSLWETLKEYNEETKWFEPTKNKKVEVAQMLSDELSDDEEVKSLLIDKLFGYKDNIKEMIMKSDYCEIPSYHKESLEKDQKIADLETKLAESETRIEELEGQFAYECECNKQFVECQNENTQLKQQLAEKEKELKYYETLLKRQCNDCKDQDKISFALEQLEKVRNNILCNEMFYFENLNKHIDEQIDNQIKQLKEMG